MEAAFFDIHRGLPREGPGDATSLGWAVRMAGLGRDASILDAGCGPGADVPTLLSHVPQGRVHAVDLHAPFVQTVRTRHAMDPRVSTAVADFTRISGQFDLIWSAGAVYGPGIGASMSAFRRMLAPGGRAAFSHLCWLGDARPAAAAEFWAREYPAMSSLEVVQAEIAATGMRIIGRQVLSDAAWEAYYRPLEGRLDALEPDASGDLAQAIAEHREEIAVWRAHRDSFGYVLFLVAR